MNENRRQILDMLAAGKINAEEAERLISALEGSTASNGARTDDPPRLKPKAKFLRVLVEANDKDAPTTVNVRVPMQLLYAGVRLASLIPAQAHEQFDEALSKHGVPLTLSQIKPENLTELIDHLEELTVDVDAKQDNTKVRVFCE